MKKAFISLFSIVIMLALLVPTASTANAASVSDNKRAVFDYLTEEIGFNSAAACGIMANIEHESNFDPTVVVKDRNGLLSGGLCMWNGSRFSSLQKFCSKNGYNYLSVQGQLRYLEYELQMDYYKHIYNYLKSVPNSSQGAYDAAYYWCYYFEIPSNRASSSVERGNKAKSSYWPVYGNAAVPDLKLTSTSSGKTVDLYASVTLKWTGGSSAANSYCLYLTQPGQSNATKITVKGSKSYTLSLKGKKAGSYSVYVVAKNSKGETIGKVSNTIKFTAKCLEHDYTKKTVREATQTKSGLITYTCKKCSATKNVSVLPLSKSNVTKATLSSLKVASASSNSIKLSWSAIKNADGYAIYKSVSGKWKLVKSVSASSTQATVTGLSGAKTYKLLVRAFVNDGDSRLYSKGKTVSAATAPAKPSFTSISRPGEGSVLLKWKKVSGADGYTVYVSSSRLGTYKKVKTVKAPSTSVTLTGLKSDRYSYFKIKAYKISSGNTAYSAYSSNAYALVK